MSEAELPPEPSAARGARAPVGWALVAVSVGAAAALLRFMNPWTGVASRHWPWELDTPIGWTRNFATLVFFSALIVVPLAAAFRRPGRLRGIIVGTTAGLALTALADISIFLYGVETYVAPLLAAIAAGGLYAARVYDGGGGRGGGRIAAGIAGAVLLGLLLYPQGSSAKPDPLRRNPAQDYHAVLPATLGEIVARAGQTEEQQRTAIEEEAGESAGALAFITHPWTMGVLLFTLVALLGLLGAFLPPRPWIAWCTLGGFLASTLYPPLWYGINAAVHPERAEEGISTLAAAAIAFAHSLREQYAPFVLALFAATVDLARPEAPRDTAKP